MEKKVDEQWHKESAYAHFICSVPGMGIKTVESLYARCGNDGGYENIYYRLTDMICRGERECKEQLGLDRRQIANLNKQFVEKDVWQEYEKLLYNRIWCIPKYLYGYPDKLKHIYLPPGVLYVKGHLPDEKKPVVAVVGARNCSPYGKMVAKEIGRELAKAGIQVVSGMARGIDGISQKSALDCGGAVFGVLGCGVDICYPEENMDIYQRMLSAKQGGVISEYSPGTAPAPGLFPLRNRIISGLADFIVVVEAREKSGTYITVTNALEQGKDVYVVPGRVQDSLSFGCNRLIAQGANVIYCVEEFVGDVLRGMGLDRKEPDTEKHATEKTTNSHVDRVVSALSKEEARIYRGLDIQFRPAEEIVAETVPQLPLSQGLVLLATLECMGLAESEGSFYRKKGEMCSCFRQKLTKE